MGKKQMQRAKVNGVELEYAMTGSGEPVLLISPVLADGFVPLLSQRALADRYRLITYHKRGWAGSTHTPGPVSIADHAADAAALLEYLDIRRAHVAGHSSGAAVGLQLALDRPQVVHTLSVLEPSILSLSCAKAFVQSASPVFETYAAGNHEAALSAFMAAVSGLEWNTCRALLDEGIPGAVAQSIQDADTFFGVELPALVDWAFDSHQAAAIRQPVLSVLGQDTQAMCVEIAGLLRSWLPQLEECSIQGAGHLLHIQRPEPVARGMAEFLGRHPMSVSSQFQIAASAV